MYINTFIRILSSLLIVNMVFGNMSDNGLPQQNASAAQLQLGAMLGLQGMQPSDSGGNTSLSLNSGSSSQRSTAGTNFPTATAAPQTMGALALMQPLLAQNILQQQMQQQLQQQLQQQMQQQSNAQKTAAMNSAMIQNLLNSQNSTGVSLSTQQQQQQQLQQQQQSQQQHNLHISQNQQQQLGSIPRSQASPLPASQSMHNSQVEALQNLVKFTAQPPQQPSNNGTDLSWLQNLISLSNAAQQGPAGHGNSQAASNQASSEQLIAHTMHQMQHAAMASATCQPSVVGGGVNSPHLTSATATSNNSASSTASNSQTNTLQNFLKLNSPATNTGVSAGLLLNAAATPTAAQNPAIRRNNIGSATSMAPQHTQQGYQPQQQQQTQPQQPQQTSQNSNQITLQSLLSQMAAQNVHTGSGPNAVSSNSLQSIVSPQRVPSSITSMTPASYIASTGSTAVNGRKNRLPMPIFMDFDVETLTEYQCLLRKQIELFEAGPEDIKASAQGRNNPILLGQVGIRCRHCTQLPLKCRPRGAVYYSRTIVSTRLVYIHDLLP